MFVCIHDCAHGSVCGSVCVSVCTSVPVYLCVHTCLCVSVSVCARGTLVPLSGHPRHEGEDGGTVLPPLCMLIGSLWLPKSGRRCRIKHRRSGAKTKSWKDLKPPFPNLQPIKLGTSLALFYFLH